jgi:nucleotide-binding universal stress UspA family protein
MTARSLHLMVPTDFSAESTEAARRAIELARDLDASVTLLHVYQFPVEVLPDGSTLLFRPSEVEEMIDGFERQLEGLRALVDDGETLITTRLEEGTPAVRILEIADEETVDLIVMGTHGRTGVRRLLLGSVAETVVRRARCPVMTVDTRTAEAAAEPR